MSTRQQGPNEVGFLLCDTYAGLSGIHFWTRLILGVFVSGAWKVPTGHVPLLHTTAVLRGSWNNDISVFD